MKGPQLDGSDSLAKLRLGRTWQYQCGAGYRYFMVFEKKEVDEDGAYTLDAFLEILKNL